VQTRNHLDGAKRRVASLDDENSKDALQAPKPLHSALLFACLAPPSSATTAHT
jgi:hypothetical protein